VFVRIVFFKGIKVSTLILNAISYIILFILIASALLEPLGFVHVDYFSTSKEATTQTHLNMIDSALERFKADFGKIPSSSSDPKESFKVMVHILTNKKACANWLISEGEKISGVDDPIFTEKWHGPYLKDPNKILDGWQRPLNYQSRIGGDPDAYALWSDGKNLKDNSDDIYSASSTVSSEK
jgi:hypothetical protein